MTLDVLRALQMQVFAPIDPALATGGYLADGPVVAVVPESVRVPVATIEVVECPMAASYRARMDGEEGEAARARTAQRNREVWRKRRASAS